MEVPRLRRERRRVRRRIQKGYDPRSAVELMIAYRITEPRAELRSARELLGAPRHLPTTPSRVDHDPTIARRTLQVTARDIARWETALSRRPRLLSRLAFERGWRYETMRGLELASIAAGSQSLSATPAASSRVCCATSRNTPAAQRCSPHPEAGSGWFHIRPEKARSASFSSKVHQT